MHRNVGCTTKNEPQNRLKPAEVGLVPPSLGIWSFMLSSRMLKLKRRRGAQNEALEDFSAQS